MCFFGQHKVMIWASLLGMLFSTVGLWLSYCFNLTSGATIILVASLGHLLSLVVGRLARGQGGQGVALAFRVRWKPSTLRMPPPSPLLNPHPAR